MPPRTGPTIAQDIARLLAIAGADRLPLGGSDPSTSKTVTSRSSQSSEGARNVPRAKATSASVVPGLAATTSAQRLQALQEAPIIFRIQTFLAAVAASVIFAAVLTSSALVLATNNEVWRYQPPVGGARTGSLVRVESPSLPSFGDADEENNGPVTQRGPRAAASARRRPSRAAVPDVLEVADSTAVKRLVHIGPNRLLSSLTG